VLFVLELLLVAVLVELLDELLDELLAPAAGTTVADTPVTEPPCAVSAVLTGDCGLWNAAPAEDWIDAEVVLVSSGLPGVTATVNVAET